MLDQAEGLLVTLDGTACAESKWPCYGEIDSVYLGITIVNRDKYYDNKATFTNPVRAVYFSDGRIFNYFAQVSIMAGPGQTKQDYITLKDIFYLWPCDPNLYIQILIDDGELEYYKANFCK